MTRPPAASTARRSAADGARSHQVANFKIAAAAGVVREHLRNGPVDRRKRRVGEPKRRRAFATHFLGREIRFHRDIEAALRGDEAFLLEPGGGRFADP